ncbi:MAG: 1-acyl-sn-glycerol-3-phosphate acyltransferase [Clostridia bacterium]|nr:MAG: 1-acyl-sn-glycerol-3-phosphate acyltransferase [Clostridia bacterium]
MFYWFARTLFCCLFTLTGWKVRGRENLPRRGPVVVISNHISLWDPIVVGTALNRRVYFMAKEELFRLPVLGLLIKGLGAFPVHRGRADLTSLRRALNLLASGQVIGVFPQGGRGLKEFRQGAALMAVRARAPIVPVAIRNKATRWPRFEVNIGTPLYWPVGSDASLAKVTREAEKAVSRLLGE